MDAQISNPQKAAVAITALGTDRAAKIISVLPGDLIEALSYHVAQLQNVPPQVSAQVVHELASNIQAGEGSSFGGLDYVVELLGLSVDEQAAESIIGHINHTDEKRPLAFLDYLHPERIALLLKGESLQTVALVLVHLPRVAAAGVLATLPEIEQAEVTLRIARLTEINPQVIRAVARELRRGLAAVGGEEQVPSSGGVPRLAEILRYTDAAAEQTVMDEFDEHEPPLAIKLRELLRTFEDIVELDDRSLQRVLRKIDRQDLLIALHVCEPQIRGRVYANLSQRGAQLLRDDLEHQPPMLKRTVHEARKRIITQVLAMEEDGQITFPRGNEQLVA